MPRVTACAGTVLCAPLTTGELLTVSPSNKRPRETHGRQTDGGENPFDGERIEIDESEMRSVARHEVLASKVTDRLDAFATRVIWGK
ncbi:hypothetical protein BRD08_00735 [Halobacteriales archaeon SW_10_66_29]|nr:MAG: hypothetical protein BRD08_00735 [Halobacteriales archaeon SW_10_66_29]